MARGGSPIDREQSRRSPYVGPKVGLVLRRLVEWIDQRTGLETAVKNFLYEDIPHSSGWRQVFGSVALFLFLVQGFTGILLALNYAPQPGDDLVAPAHFRGADGIGNLVEAGVTTVALIHTSKIESDEKFYAKVAEEGPAAAFRWRNAQFKQ